jgi:hypothetical protein
MRRAQTGPLRSAFAREPAVVEKSEFIDSEFIDMISEATRQSRRRVMLPVVDLPTAPKETSRLGHWPPEHWAQWRLEKLTPWKVKPWEGKDWD